MQPGANIERILVSNLPTKVDGCVGGALIGPELGVFLKALNRQRNNFAHRLGHRLSFEDAFALVQGAATAGVNFSNDEIHTSEVAARDHYGVEHIIVEIYSNVAQDIGFALTDRGLGFPVWIKTAVIVSRKAFRLIWLSKACFRQTHDR